MAVIPEEEISYSKLSLIDPVGRLFHWKGRIYRGIYPKHAGLIRELFASGFLEELTQRGFFPRSQITDHVVDGFSFVVEHETIPFVVYPHEWSFDMLRDVTIMILQIVEIGEKFGWQLNDPHPHNVLFNGTRPMYIDLGSFRKKSKRAGFERGAYFLQIYWRTLYVWTLGDGFLAQRILTSPDVSLPDVSWLLYKHPALRYLDPRFAGWLGRRYTRWSRRVSRLFLHGRLLSWLSPGLASRLPATLLARNTDLLRRKILRLKQPPPSVWDDYHSEHMQKGKITSTPRFDRILKVIDGLGVESVTELAGNQGLFTLLLAAKTQVKKIVCTDCSSSAVNRFYKYCREHADQISDSHVQPAVLDFMIPETASLPAPPERLVSDVVVAVAVTHHLTLSQNFPLSEVFRIMASYTRRFIVVEFMPLGLWNGKTAPPVPDWYTKDWFQQAFSQRFDLMAVEELEKNRMLFVGRLKILPAAGRDDDPFGYFERNKLAA